MKSVLISIKPKWGEKICNGEKTIEVRKSAPKEVPFKCYIYCTASNAHDALVVGGGEAKLIHCCNYKSAIPVGGVIGNGKVIGEFICRGIMQPFDSLRLMAKESCLTEEDLVTYSNGKPLYGWRIADLKIYDKPRELSEFYTIDESGSDCCVACVYHETPLDEMPCRTCTSERRYLYRPPQSWQYVEELGE